MNGPQLTVDLAAVAANTRTLLATGTHELMAVVKADGFGHGAREVAATALAHGATRLGVTSLAEAAAVLDLGVPVLSWLNAPGAGWDDPATAAVEVAVPSLHHLTAVCSGAAATGRRRRVHLHVDTGMSRDGCPAEEWATLCRAARRAEQLGPVEVVGVMSHLGCAAEPADPCNTAAAREFARAAAVARRTGLRPSVLHLAATAATLSAPGTHHDLVRVGAGLVGIDPTGAGRLTPALTLTAPVVQVRRVRAGRSVGYGHDHRTGARSTLALVGVGYADGIPRAASTSGQVLLRGRRYPLIGAVSMDQLVVDLGDDHAEPGDEVVLFGPGDRGEPTVAQWAGWSGTIEHELVTGTGTRLPRRHLPAPASPVLDGRGPRSAA